MLDKKDMNLFPACVVMGVLLLYNEYCEVVLLYLGKVQFYVIGGDCVMKICLKCKQLCNDDTLTNCPKCQGELIQYSQEKYEYYLNNQKQGYSKYTSKEDRMYQDIHTIKNILVLFAVLVIFMLIANFFILMG